MSKYDSLKEFKRTKARTSHLCSKCGAEVNVDEYYFKEQLKDRFLHSLHATKLCSKCFELMSSAKK